MWLSEKINKSGAQKSAERGEVTLSSRGNWEAEASGRVRNIGAYLPYGYSSLPPAGAEVLLLPLSDSTVSLGVRAENTGLSAGEIRIRSLGGAYIELKNDGTVIINGAFGINREGAVFSAE